MAPKVTTKQWIERAKSTWGDRYDYSQVEYLNAKTPVRVICSNHGEWSCQPDNHVSKKRGCPVCGGSQRKTTASFSEEAHRLHEGLYDYSKVDYQNARTRVAITCSRHGSFWQTPDAHLSGNGCPKCRDEKTSERSALTEKEIVQRLSERSQGWEALATLVSGTYRGMNKRFQINCSVHGPQEPRIGTSIFSSPQPCLVCSETAQFAGYTTVTYLQHLEERFSGKYEILPFQYQGKKTVIRMMCPVVGHGEFELLAGSVHRSPGCPKCAYAESSSRRFDALREKTRSTHSARFQAWLKAAYKRHGDFFDYSNVDFVDQHEPVTIVCPVHGKFRQPPKTHLKSGCKQCASENLFGLYSERFFELNPDAANDPATLYYLRFQCGAEVWFKVGITRTSIARRFGAAPKHFVSITTLGKIQTTLRDAWLIEREIQETHGDSCRCTPVLKGTGMSPREMRIGASECFSAPLPPDTAEKFFGTAAVISGSARP